MTMRGWGLGFFLLWPGIALADLPWLYLGPSGGWIAQTVTPTVTEPFAIELPSSAGTVWVEREGSLDYWVRERETGPANLAAGAALWIPPSVGSRAGLRAGDYTVVQVLPFGVSARPVVDEDQLVIVPQEVLSASEITVSESPTDSLRLYGAGTEPRKIAWWQADLTGSVQYRLDVDSDARGTLTQSLEMDNQGSALRIAGLSYQETGSGGSRPVMALSEAQTRADAPIEQVVGHSAVITRSGEQEVPAGAHWVVPVSSQTVDLAYSYRHDLYLGNEVLAQPARLKLRLTTASDDGLPRLAGALSVNWFDGARARQATQYSGGDPEQADLDLPASPLVSAGLEFREGSETGTLTVHNRTGQTVTWQASISWYRDNERQSADLDARLPEGTTTWQLQRTGARLQFSRASGE